MKRKILILALCFTLIFSNISKSYSESRIAPAIPLVAPQVISSLGALMVMCGVKYVDYKSLNHSIRDIWETKDFKTEVLPSIESSIANSVNGVVNFSKNVVDWFKNEYFPTVQPGSNIIISDIPCYAPSLEEEQYFSPGGNPNPGSLALNIQPTWSITYGQSIPNIDLGNGFTIRYSGNDFVNFYYNNTKLSYVDIASGSKYMGLITIIYLNGKMYLTRKVDTGWVSSSINILSKLSSYEGDVVNAWVNYGSIPNIDSNIDENGEISISIPGDINDLIGVDTWIPSVDNVWNGTDSITIPSLDNPLVDVSDDILVDVPDIDVPDVIDPPLGGVIPSFPSFGDSLDFSPMYLTNINDKFPFSLPWDIGRLIQKFDVEPKAPIFKVPIVTSDIELDLTIFDEWANIVRFFILIGFALSLILISTKLLG